MRERLGMLLARSHVMNWAFSCSQSLESFISTHSGVTWYTFNWAYGHRASDFGLVSAYSLYRLDSFSGLSHSWWFYLVQYFQIKNTKAVIVGGWSSPCSPLHPGTFSFVLFSYRFGRNLRLRSTPIAIYWAGRRRNFPKFRAPSSLNQQQQGV